jgi:hypothetical protein
MACCLPGEKGDLANADSLKEAPKKQGKQSKKKKNKDRHLQAMKFVLAKGEANVA